MTAFARTNVEIFLQNIRDLLRRKPPLGKVSEVLKSEKIDITTDTVESIVIPVNSHYVNLYIPVGSILINYDETATETSFVHGFSEGSYALYVQEREEFTLYMRAIDEDATVYISAQR